MRIITAIVATSFALGGAAYAQTNTVPTAPKDNPRVEQNEKDKQKGNVENQNQQDIKAKEQAPTTGTNPKK